jgi:hypothetical protein
MLDAGFANFEVIPVREFVTAIRPAPAAARAAAITPPAAEAGETRGGGTDGFPLHPGEAAAEMDGSPEADASPFQLHPGEVAAPVRVAVVQVPPEPPRDEIEPLDAQLARLHVTVFRRLLEKLEAAKDALAHACPGATAAEVFERGLDLVLAQHANARASSRSRGRCRAPPALAPFPPK